jgi:hypothetical protein
VLRAIITCTVICFFSVSSYAAETAAEAMRIFGLLGTWSEDCAKDPSRENSDRETYTAPARGPPKRTIVTTSIRSDKRYVSEDINEIMAALRVTQNKIKLTVSYLEDTEMTDLVYVRDGAKLRLWYAYHYKAGHHTIKDGFSYIWLPDSKTYSTLKTQIPPIEKCLD